MAKKNCNHCGRYLDEEESNWRYKSLGIRHKTCRKCAHEHNKKYFEGDAKEGHLENVRSRKLDVRTKGREYIYEYLLSHTCIQCGESDPLVLEFHHLHGKEMAVGQMVSEGYPLRSKRN